MAELPIEKLREMAETAADLTSEARTLSETCRSYYDGDQWTAEEIATLRKRKQPIVTINRIQRKVDAMIGIEQRSRTDPRALGRTPKDDQAADIATKALVYIDDTTRFDAKRSMAFENLIIEGYGGVEVTVEQKRGKFEICITRIRWEEIFFDPHSREKDFSDAAYMGSMKWMTLDAANQLYASAYQGEEPLETVLEQSMNFVVEGETYDDRPYKSAAFWSDAKLRRVRIAQMYYQRDGLWYLAIYAGKGIIINAPSPYMDEDGRPTNPMVLMTAYIDRDNNRYGVVKSMLSAQDEVNARRSKLLHMLNSRQTMGVKGAVSVATLKNELAKPDGHVEVDADAAAGAREAGMPAFQVLQTQDQVAGQFNLLVESKQEIDTLGPNASLLGQLGGQQSGRAIMAQQQAGLVELAPIYDSLRDWTLRVYRQMWMRTQQFWTEERWVRVTDEAQAPQFIGVNQIVGMDPYTMQPIMENQIAQMDVDIIIDEAPDIVTLRQEEFEQLASMAQQGIPIPPEMLIEASSVRNKQRLLEMMGQQKEQAMQQQAQAMQMQTQIEGQRAANETATAQAKAQRDTAEAQKTLAEIPGVQAQARTAEMRGAVQEFTTRRSFGL